MKLVIPAAGLGTRLRPYSDACSKEMLVVAGQRLIDWALQEARAAGDVAVVVHPRKADLVEHLRGRVRLVVQPEPSGVADAIERGREALGGGPVAVLYPDYLLRPDTCGLATLLAGHHGGWTYATIAGDPLPRGRTVRIETDGPRITVVHPAAIPAPGTTHTVFAEVRPAPLPTRDDADLLRHLADAAAAGDLFGVPLPGTLYDVGTRAGYEHALEALG